MNKVKGLRGILTSIDSLGDFFLSITQKEQLESIGDINLSSYSGRAIIRSRRKRWSLAPERKRLSGLQVGWIVWVHCVHLSSRRGLDQMTVGILVIALSGCVHFG